MNKILIWTYKPFGEHKKNSAKEFVSKISMPNVKIVVLDLSYKL